MLHKAMAERESRRGQNCEKLYPLPPKVLAELMQLAELAEEARITAWRSFKVCREARQRAITVAQQHGYPISCLAKMFNVTDQQLHNLKANHRSG